MSSIQEGQFSELSASWSSVLSEPIPRCSSPPPALECDGFHCDEYSVETAHVLALGACKDGQKAWEDQHGQSMTAVLVELLEKNPNPCLNELMKTISHNTYETVCQLHAAWKAWQADRIRQGRMDRQPRTSTEEEEDREYEIMRKGDPLKRFQDPQLASHMKLDMNMPFTL